MGMKKAKMKSDMQHKNSTWTGIYLFIYLFATLLYFDSESMYSLW